MKRWSIQTFTLAIAFMATFFLASSARATTWDSPVNYARTPTGSTPDIDMLFYVEFDDHTGCNSETYSFAIYEGTDNFFFFVGDPVQLVSGTLTQSAVMPNDVGVDKVRLVCLNAIGGVDAYSDTLEGNSQVFKPYNVPASTDWTSPLNYRRYPSGSDPADQIFFFAEFDDNTGCPDQTYRLWAYVDDSPDFPIGEYAGMQDGIWWQYTTPADETEVEDLRLVCVNAIDGEIYAGSNTSLEFGSPAFTTHLSP
jgi:hypothetical protein